MATLLIRRAAVAAALATALSIHAAESDRHELHVDVSAAVLGSSTNLEGWADGGFSKLSVTDDGATVLRVFAEYRARIAPTLNARIVADYTAVGASGIDLTEAVIDWRPIPTSRNQQQWRFGAFYPPFSLENGERGWQSPYTYSYSAINTWLGEEIRPLGAEWSLRRRLDGAARGHEIKGFAAAFYGNDPAGTLLFWRGFGLHDRQSRWNDRLAIPGMPTFNGSGALIEQPLAVFTDTDQRPGAYAGVEWRYARRALVQWARYDNRADVHSYSADQRVWGWRTAFDHVALQVTLPAEIGLVAQWMDGSTEWLARALPDGTLRPGWGLVEDDFTSRFLLLTRKLGAASRLTLRYDEFDISRPALESDHGHAWTLAYRLEPAGRFHGGVEWLRVVSERATWPAFYGLPLRQSEEQLRVQMAYRLGMPGR
jgi:hypothetical protein